MKNYAGFIAIYAALSSLPAYAQPQQAANSAKLLPFYQQQRNTALDNLASCAAAVNDLQARIADLEKQLSDAKAAK